MVKKLALMKVQGKMRKIVGVIWTPQIVKLTDLLLRIREEVNVSSSNKFPFARRVGESHYNLTRVRVFKHMVIKAELKEPGNITARTLRTKECLTFRMRASASSLIEWDTLPLFRS